MDKFNKTQVSLSSTYSLNMEQEHETKNWLDKYNVHMQISDEPATSSDNESASMYQEERYINDSCSEKSRSEKSNFDIIVEHLDALNVKDSDYLINEMSQLEIIFSGLKHLIQLPLNLFSENSESKEKVMKSDAERESNASENNINWCSNWYKTNNPQKDSLKINFSTICTRITGENNKWSWGRHVIDNNGTLNEDWNNKNEGDRCSLMSNQEPIMRTHEFNISKPDHSDLRIDSDNVEAKNINSSHQLIENTQDMIECCEGNQSKRGADYKKILREFKKYYIKSFTSFEKELLKSKERDISLHTFCDKLELYLSTRNVCWHISQTHHYHLGLIINPAKVLECKHENNEHQNDQYELDSKKNTLILQDLIFKFSLSKAKEFFKLKENQDLFNHFLDKNEGFAKSWLFEVQSIKGLF